MQAIRYLTATVTAILFGGIALTIGLWTGEFGSRFFFFYFGIAMCIGFVFGQRMLSRLVR